MIRIRNKKAQISIWVILGVILIASIILIFLLREEAGPEIPGRSEGKYNIESYLKSCLSRDIDDVTNIMIPQGGLLNLRNSVFFNNTNIEYMCYYQGYWDPCINQHPVLIQEIKKDILSYITPKAELCLNDIKEDLENKNIKVALEDSSPLKINIDFSDDRIFIELNKKMTIKNNEETRDFEKFDFQFSSPIFNLANIAIEIADQEAKYCYFEYVGYSIIYPRYQISLFTMSDSTRIYTIKDTKTKKEMNIAIRGCALPQGLPA